MHRLRSALGSLPRALSCKTAPFGLRGQGEVNVAHNSCFRCSISASNRRPRGCTRNACTYAPGPRRRRPLH
eukprot:3201640-Pleurochrysis_carterae.AAC.2